VRFDPLGLAAARLGKARVAEPRRFFLTTINTCAAPTSPSALPSSAHLDPSTYRCRSILPPLNVTAPLTVAGHITAHQMLLPPKCSSHSAVNKVLQATLDLTDSYNKGTTIKLGSYRKNHGAGR
jgi:hypothetical protein